ncbi:MAG: methylmalonyl Co-A mutase-associated GTPase MeaB [Desulfarculaceae bacterium]|nr:methylmalonyl Co-A mutase-associated GTPase MeaB [Desulfarculaceae bacterium]MCF8047146.1 methylmalonyl Co-A mutase-associated GTPase MeaB [Desulfarculaceae bacterium]MCF8063777.1 methylmalonyl Co-A mutase-associated GTPase MeaB [Desulfarculaceae bacterium]MCF8099627.1 methylmalonyl Co-A mutase-associated GTPase MeaB [Desulfarculaceae bacterium]MCF8120773.1 methylmalonyl Co-A mutase-associated GTPase MeaB [Desulfarculaceae bacterium]
MTPEEIAQRIVSGDIPAAARLMRAIDDVQPEAVGALKLLFPHTGRARVIGITGSPGVGKSTLTDAVVTRLRRKGLTVGVVAVDPTSPFSGGAILGDRIRMQRHANDNDVFIRSLATRGHFGGLTCSTRGVVAVMDAMGKDVVLVETVGVGQDEVDIARMADTTVIVTVPGMGDDVQAIKAGILEVGDVFVVNKMDRDGAGITAGHLKAMLSLTFHPHGSECDQQAQPWYPPVVSCCSLDGRGMDELLQAMDDHYDALSADGGKLLAKRRIERAEKEILDLFQLRINQMFFARLGNGGRIEAVAKDVASMRTDPYTACEELMKSAKII